MILLAIERIRESLRSLGILVGAAIGASAVAAAAAAAAAADSSWAARLPPPRLSENVTRVSEHVQIILGFPNIAIISGNEATLVVDTGLGPSNGATVARVVEKLGGSKKLYLTTTHFHPEHAAGVGGFPAGTILIRPAVQQRELDEHGDQMLAMFRQLSPVYAQLLQGVGPLRRPDIVFGREVTIDLGGVSARLLWLGAGHTQGDELTFVEPDRTLVSGDIVQNKVVPNVTGGGSLGSWLAVLDRAQALEPLHVVPDHSSPGDGSLIAEDKAFILDMRARTLALKKQGMSAADAAKPLTAAFDSAYPAWAGNTQWPNAQIIPVFVRQVYEESR